jgi:hypothetical protein
VDYSSRVNERPAARHGLYMGVWSSHWAAFHAGKLHCSYVCTIISAWVSVCGFCECGCALSGAGAPSRFSQPLSAHHRSSPTACRKAEGSTGVFVFLYDERTPSGSLCPPLPWVPKPFSRPQETSAAPIRRGQMDVSKPWLCNRSSSLSKRKLAVVPCVLVGRARFHLTDF